MLRHLLLTACHRSLFQTSRPSLITAPQQFLKSSPNCVNVCDAMFQQTQSYSSIFTTFSGDSLWEGVTGPKGSSKKRARGKRRVTRPKIDLNRGQRIGFGKSAMMWPGLTNPIVSKAGETSKISQGEIDPEYEKRIREMRNRTAMKKKTRSLPPLLRGWTGNKFGGQSVGPPEPTPECSFEGFDSRVLELKVVSRMTATYGRTARFSAFVITGNGNGLAGYALAKGAFMKTAIRQAKKQAAQNLELFSLRDNRTLWHPAYIHEWNSKILAKPMPPGYGLVCHRCIKTICKVAGIKDIHVKVEGATTNYQTITKGFLKILRSQETYQDLANREQLHVVEISKDRDFVPKVLASPVQGFTRSLEGDEDLDMSRYYFAGHVPYVKKKEPFYYNNDGNVKARYDRYPFRNRESVRLMSNVYSRLHGSASKPKSTEQSSEESQSV